MQSSAPLVTVADALARVLERAAPLGLEEVPLAAAAGRVLRAPARAATDLPPFPSSAMDGFAVRAADTPGVLRVAGSAAAGRPFEATLGAGEAVGIATGAVVPEGADAVVPVELVRERDGSVEVPEAGPGRHIRSAGGDVRRGEVVAPAGVVLGAAQLGALAAAGVAGVTCGVRPRVALLATGTELRAAGEALRRGEIYESNATMLAAAAAAAGALVARLDVVADDEGAHRTALAGALDGDVLVTTGGVSVGPHDLVRRIERELGVEEVFWGVAMRPGKPLAFGVRGRTLVFGLPGNPVSSLVAFELFVRPALRALQGAAEPGPPFEPGVLASPLRRHEARDDFVRARRHPGAAAVVLDPIAGQESHMIARAAVADALVEVPCGAGDLPAGAAVRYLRLA